NRRTMEKHYHDSITLYPRTQEVHFTELQDSAIGNDGRTRQKTVDDFSTDDIPEYRTEDLRLRKTAVFVDRFFNRLPIPLLAEKYGVEENSIVSMYSQAVEHVERIIEALDARREGIKATKPDKFNDDQKFFLLCNVFGFTQVEVARMFNRDRDVVNKKVKRMADTYAALFDGQELQEETPIDDPPIDGKLTRGQVVNMVENYVDQGLSHRQAFMRIAERYAQVVRRPVSHRGIESRYYKAMACPA
ncbi:hypothetical protein, partial [Desulfatitalea tepidiphila]|uniref:hypothetical protein n=1 Tax=Desulfatitalea tepidiphila TaxID=1185843 RepID=UPI0013792F95